MLKDSIAGSLDRDFVRLVSLSRPPVKPFEDEGFESGELPLHEL